MGGRCIDCWIAREGIGWWEICDVWEGGRKGWERNGRKAVQCMTRMELQQT